MAENDELACTNKKNPFDSTESDLLLESLAELEIDDGDELNLENENLKIDKNNPAYIPKRGKFYEHDNRLDGAVDNKEK